MFLLVFLSRAAPFHNIFQIGADFEACKIKLAENSKRDLVESKLVENLNMQLNASAEKVLSQNIQWGSKIWMYLDFDWANAGWFMNRSRFQMASEIRKPSYLKSRNPFFK